MIELPDNAVPLIIRGFNDTRDEEFAATIAFRIARKVSYEELQDMHTGIGLDLQDREDIVQIANHLMDEFCGDNLDIDVETYEEEICQLLIAMLAEIIREGETT